MSDASQHSTLLDDMQRSPIVDPDASTRRPEERAAPVAPIMNVNRAWVSPHVVGEYADASPSRWFG